MCSFLFSRLKSLFIFSFVYRVSFGGVHFSFFEKGDYCLLAGSPADALIHYEAAKVVVTL